MFKTESYSSVEGAVLGHEVMVTVRVSGAEVDASPLPAQGDAPLMVDTHNIHTLIASAINKAMMRLQHMDGALDGESIHNWRTGVATKTHEQAEAQPQREAVAVVPYPRKTNEGEGIN